MYRLRSYIINLYGCFELILVSFRKFIRAAITIEYIIFQCLIICNTRLYNFLINKSNRNPISILKIIFTVYNVVEQLLQEHNEKGK